MFRMSGGIEAYSLWQRHNQQQRHVVPSEVTAKTTDDPVRVKAVAAPGGNSFDTEG